MKLCGCWIKWKRMPCPGDDPVVHIQAINHAASHNSGQLKLKEQIEGARAFNSVRLLQDRVLYTDEDEDFAATFKHMRPASPMGYALDIDFTAAKVVSAVAEKCKLFQCQCVSVQYKEGCQELQTILDGLHDILSLIQGSSCLKRYKEPLEETLLYSSRAYAFVEKVLHEAMPNSLQVPSLRVRKTHARFRDFACRFYNLKVQLCKEFEKNAQDMVEVNVPRGERLSFGVTTYLVPIQHIATKLYKHKRVVLPLTEVDGKSRYTVEVIYPRSWLSDDVGLKTKVESQDRGYNQILQADHVKIEKGGWGWEAAQDTVLITFDDVLVANVAAIAGGLLQFNKDFSHEDGMRMASQTRHLTSIQLIGSSRMDMDLHNLFIKGTKDADNVYLKCFVTTPGEEVLAIYRYRRTRFHDPQGWLHVVGRGNQPGLRHVLVSIFSSIGFTAVA